LVVDVSVVEFRKFESLFVDDFGELQLSTIAVMAAMIISFMAICFIIIITSIFLPLKKEKP